VKKNKLEPGSFRDRESRVFYESGVVFRGLSKQALREWEVLSSKGFFSKYVSEGKIIQTEEVDLRHETALSLSNGWAGVLKHTPVSFISYPYEWSFGMLKDAALLQLDLVLAAIDEDMILKDSSAFNIQWTGTCPVFIDIPSFTEVVPGEPWVGYKQFCEMFLYPLILKAYKDVPFHPWLRGNIDGIKVNYCRNLLSHRDLLRPGVFTHVYLQSIFQKKFSQTKKDVKGAIASSGFKKELIKVNVKRLKETTNRLIWKRSMSEWSNYMNSHSYADHDHEMKQKFVREVVYLRRWKMVWDIGCNTGIFSRIASENAEYVIAMDADHLAIDLLYRELKSKGMRSILPLVINLADPSPDLGWRGLERKALHHRGRPDLVLCLALIHHMVISANIPMTEFIEWLSSLGSSVVIEFVTREDPMVKTLLRNKRDNYVDYNLDYFTKCLSKSFRIVRQQALSSNTRIMFFATLDA
jgi:2-polyprenyl-3-methyl-5-hydroxy-6-metoxy-1,4-benzoquinol methylase